ncbi:MAG: ABC transporter ATP-binding protein [Synergistaceae bacterium]|jgi:peptide/nickel transport system ATP-binding protein|nr:ABC transporter ATP-binding protein [Synergistaceae bacterium]
MNVTGNLLEVRNLKKYFDVTHGFSLNGERQYVRAVDDVSFDIKPGETLGLVGESGCGKSTIGNCIIRLLDPTGGDVFFEGRNIALMNQRELKPIRRDIQMIFQDPYSSLNPRMRVFDLIAEPFRANAAISGRELEDEIYHLLEVVGLPLEYAGRFPHEFSGGQRQRIGIARALALKPKLIICDEPISALDVSIQAQILNLLTNLQEQFGLTYIFVSHSLPSIKHVSRRVAVMYLGRLVEYADTTELFRHPSHPYTEGLMGAIPIPDPALRAGRSRVILQGDIPSLSLTPSGCYFHPRCSYCVDECRESFPPLFEAWPNHKVACFHPLEHASGVL